MRGTLRTQPPPRVSSQMLKDKEMLEAPRTYCLYLLPGIHMNLANLRISVAIMIPGWPNELDVGIISPTFHTAHHRPGLYYDMAGFWAVFIPHNMPYLKASIGFVIVERLVALSSKWQTLTRNDAINQPAIVYIYVYVYTYIHIYIYTSYLSIQYIMVLSLING